MDDTGDDEKLNFYRLSRLILDVGTHTLQSLFEKTYATTGDLQTFLNSKNRKLNKLYRRKIISQHQKELLQPSNGTKPVLKDFDISLVSALLTNLCSIPQPLAGWAVPPTANDTSTGADILRLRTVRNELYAHRANSSIDDATFQKEWKEIVDSVSRISNQLGIQEKEQIRYKIANIKTASINFNQTVQTTLCDILRILEATRPDTSGVISSDDEDDATDAEIPRGPDGIICVIKQYPKLKSEFPKDCGVTIARHLLHAKLINMDEYDQITDSSRTRRVCIDRLLKMVVRGNSKLLECVFNKLRNECPSLAIALSNTEVTEDDKRKFKQGTERFVANSIYRITLTSRFDDWDIRFFQDHLHYYPEVVDGINDDLLSQFLIGIWEHSKITYCDCPHEMILTLFETTQSCHLQLESVLQNKLPSDLFNEWTNVKNNKCHQRALKTCLPKFTKYLNFEKFFTEICQKKLLDQPSCSAIYMERTQSDKTIRLLSIFQQKDRLAYEQFKDCLVRSSHSYLRNVLEVEENSFSIRTSAEEQSGDQSTSRTFLQWIRSGATRILEPFSRDFRMRFIRAEEGSIILTFGATKDFYVGLLHPGEMEMHLEKLLRKCCFESKIKFDGPVYVTVYIESPGDDGAELYIQLHLDVESCHGGQSEKKANLERHELKLLVEELNPSQLQRWIVNQPNIKTDIKEELEDIFSRKGLSRQEKMESLLKIIIKLENCREILKRFCKQNDRYVYRKMFRQSDEMPSRREIGLSYNKGGGLQKLYSMWININDDQGPFKGDSQSDLGLTTKVREKDQTEKDSLADEGKEKKSCKTEHI